MKIIPGLIFFVGFSIYSALNPGIIPAIHPAFLMVGNLLICIIFLSVMAWKGWVKASWQYLGMATIGSVTVVVIFIVVNMQFLFIDTIEGVIFIDVILILLFIFAILKPLARTYMGSG